MNKDKLSDFNKKLLIAMNLDAIETKKEPYISINKLAEYTQANAFRRRQIIKTLKEDVEFKKRYYQQVKAVIPKYFKSGYDIKLIENAIKTSESKEITTSWTESDKKNTILALKSLARTELPDLSDYEVSTDLMQVDDILLSGLKIIIKPELYLRNIHSGKIGAIKFHLSKTEANRLTQRSMQYAATTLKFSLIEHGVEEKGIDNNGCLSVDVFEENYANSPGAYKRDLATLAASCEEILAGWDTA